jgi:hypothetical protein
MVRKFARGDRVKLTDLMVRTIMRGVAKPRKRNDRCVSWEGRFGEVKSASSTDVVILWDGRKTYDRWPPGALEKMDCDEIKIPVCTDNLNAGVAVMKSAQDGA